MTKGKFKIQYLNELVNKEFGESIKSFIIKNRDLVKIPKKYKVWAEFRVFMSSK